MTRRCVTDEQYGLLTRRIDEVRRRVDEGTIPFDITMTRLQSILEGRGFEGDLIHGLFATPAQQLEMAKILNIQNSWGFTEEDFTALGPAPTWPTDSRLAVVILDVSLDTVQTTFDTAWQLAAAKQPSFWRWDGLKSDPSNLRPLSGQYSRGLRWRIVDLGANQSRKPVDVRNAATSPGSAILWMAYYSPKWVDAMNGRDIPYVWLPGYEACTPDFLVWQGVPGLGRGADGRQIGLDAGLCGDQGGGWAVAAFRD